MVEVLYRVADAVTTIWTVTGVLVFLGQYFRGLRSSFASTVWAELRPFYLPAWVLWAAAGIATGHNHPSDLIAYGFGLVNWIVYRDIGDDDDRWRRRRKRLVEKIAQHGGKLVVVPATEGMTP